MTFHSPLTYASRATAYASSASPLIVSCSRDAYDSMMSMSPSVREEIRSQDNSVSLCEPAKMDRPVGAAFFSRDARRESLLLGPNKKRKYSIFTMKNYGKSSE